MTKKVAIIYHASCADGFGAAWAAWKKFGAKADYYPVKPCRLPHASLSRRDVYVLDSSLSKEDMAVLETKKNRVTIIDHHASSEEVVKSFSHFVFDNDHSGAVLSWRFFHPGKPVPYFLRAIEDIDLWRFKVPYSREINAMVFLNIFDFAVASKLARAVEDPKTRASIIAQGKLLLRYEKVLVNAHLSKAYPVEFDGHHAYAVNTPVLPSETGNALVEAKAPLAIMWYEQGNVRKVSLRSDGSVDVSAIAEKFGGGGHKASAAFYMPKSEPMPWKDKKTHE